MSLALSSATLWAQKEVRRREGVFIGSPRQDLLSLTAQLLPVTAGVSSSHRPCSLCLPQVRGLQQVMLSGGERSYAVGFTRNGTPAG